VPEGLNVPIQSEDYLDVFSVPENSDVPIVPLGSDVTDISEVSVSENSGPPVPPVPPPGSNLPTKALSGK